MKVVLDTNVIVSGLNFPGNERLILELVFRGWFQLNLSHLILDEVVTVLTRKFNWSQKRPSQALWALGDAATMERTSCLIVGARHWQRASPILGMCDTLEHRFRRVPSDPATYFR